MADGARARRALITGAAGQDGSLLAEILLGRGYEVVGIVRGAESDDYPNLRAVRDQLTLIRADLLDQGALGRILARFGPSEVYNLASPSFVPRSWQEPVRTAEFAAVGVTAMLEAIRNVDPSIRFYQASSSEIFGEPQEAPQTELTPIGALTPYGAAKAYGHLITRGYRRRYGLFACSGILFNHESPRRPVEFLPRKVANGAARIAAGLDDQLVLGDLESRRDWGYARDYVEAMWLMLQQSEADDYVIATGETHTVGELVEIAFRHVGLDWRKYVRSDPSFVRGPAELHNLIGDPSKAETRLGWRRTLDFGGTIHLLVDADVRSLASDETAGA